MGREILFRGKRKDNGEWIEGGYAEHDGKAFIVTWVRYIPDTRDWDTVEYYENNPHYNSSLIEVLPETVCQYTGLTDKNGKNIFEGDIVKGVAYSIDFIGYIVWIDAIAGFGVRYFNKNREPTAWENSSILKAIQRWKQPNEFQAEIIGNIFDNEELLNQ